MRVRFEEEERAVKIDMMAAFVGGRRILLR
jgi:hypothetical protein